MKAIKGLTKILFCEKTFLRAKRFPYYYYYTIAWKLFFLWGGGGRGGGKGGGGDFDFELYVNNFLGEGVFLPFRGLITK